METLASPSKRPKWSDGDEKVAMHKSARKLIEGVRCGDLESVVDSVEMYRIVEQLIKDRKELYTLTAAKLYDMIPLILKSPVKISHELTPDFEFKAINTPAEEACFVISDAIRRQHCKERGNGFYAAQDIEAGTLLLVEKPLVSTLDSDLTDKPWEEDDNGDTQALFLALGQQRDQTLPWLTHFHPSYVDHEEKNSYAEADAAAWHSKDQKIHCDASEMKRYRCVCRCNSLGFYTSSEQLCYNYTYRPLTGTGLYVLASTFNHSCVPNVSRYHIGDVSLFRTMRPVKAGEELCITYCELETLMESRFIRHQALDRDFTCTCAKCVEDLQQGDEARKKEAYFDITQELIAELTLLPPKERCENVEEIISGSVKLDDGSTPRLLFKDAQDLRCMLGRAYMEWGMERRMASKKEANELYGKAREVWQDTAQLTVQAAGGNCDEGVVVCSNQALLCDLEMGNKSLLDVCDEHKIVFGGDKRWYEMRYKHEVAESMISEETKDAWSALLRGV